MLVLNTTSPPVSPFAPAAAPRNQVPSSSARIASICSCCFTAEVAPFDKLRTAARGEPVEPCQVGGLGVLCGSFLSFQRRRHAVLLARDDANGRRPETVAVVLEANGVRAGGNRRQRHRRRADQGAVHEYFCADRPRIDGERADEPSFG